MSYLFYTQSEFGNKEFMIWATVSSWSCFCWLYRTSPSLAAKNIISLVSVLTVWWCPCVVLSLHDCTSHSELPGRHFPSSLSIADEETVLGKVTNIKIKIKIIWLWSLPLTTVLHCWICCQKYRGYPELNSKGWVMVTKNIKYWLTWCQYKIFTWEIRNKGQE